MTPAIQTQTTDIYTDEQRAMQIKRNLPDRHEIESVAPPTTYQKQQQQSLSAYGVTGALIALVAIAFVVALCIATLASFAR